MRPRHGILLTIVFSALMGFLVANITDRSKTDFFLVTPVMAGFVAGIVLLVIMRWSQITKRRSRLLVALLGGLIMIGSYENFRYQAFMERSYESMESGLSRASAYQLIDESIREETGFSGIAGYLVYRANNTTYFVQTSKTDFTKVASPLQIWGNIALEALFLIVLPFGVVWFGSRPDIDDILREKVSAESRPLAYFRNPRNEAVPETFRAKNWPVLLEMVYAGSAPTLPALEIHQSQNTDPITGNYYLYLVERRALAQPNTLKTQLVGDSDLRNFIERLLVPIP